MDEHATRRAAWSAALCAATLAATAACHRSTTPDGATVARPPADSATLAAGGAVAHDTLRGAGRQPASQRAATDSAWSGSSPARVEDLMEGRFPGVRVIHVPGQGISVRIRGATSVNGSNEPLYVVDGFPIVTSGDGLLALNPSDIARIEVLKDAGSIAEYGMRGANGVVLITTKKQ